ncbi:mitochondrial-processing peptidase alpha [Cyclospora cayetanensis]|uniref:Mitochondrial-processing peptidase alpha n=1 Tax=Cyclospora cayetanensis TaxID=88456 RepID=A0A1D3CTP3_9EIME|nr:mitochondrial-processing peptidase alpha [Cyclospora cayetanensis]
MSSRLLCSAAARLGARASAAAPSGISQSSFSKVFTSHSLASQGIHATLTARRCLAVASAGASVPAAAAAATTGAPQYRRVPFVKEDLTAVMREVPDFKYYYIGSENASSYPYKNVPLDQPILDAANLGSATLPKADVEYSMLENGLRIASVDRGGLVSSLGLFVNTGSRWEDVTNFGVSHMLQTMAFHSTAHLSFLRTVKSIEVMGASAACAAGREHIMYTAECQREQMPLLLPMLTGNVLFPRLLPWELKANHDKLLHMKHRIERTPDQMVSELLHTTAWHNNTLGHKLYAAEKSLQHFNADTIRSFILDHFSPGNMVCVGVNVAHDDLCKWLMRSFVDYNAVPPKERKAAKPVYTGGDARMEAVSPHAHIAIAFETGWTDFGLLLSESHAALCRSCYGHIVVLLLEFAAMLPPRSVCSGGWNSGDLVAYSLLQTLVGGGGAFSTGGPGKGMYTRLYLDVLNKHEWVESAMAFNTQYSDSGIFGLYMLAAPDKVAFALTASSAADAFLWKAELDAVCEGRGPAIAIIGVLPCFVFHVCHRVLGRCFSADLRWLVLQVATAVKVLAEQFAKMRRVSAEEFNRAKNSLKSSIHMNLECRGIVMEDIGRQLLMSGRVISPQEFCKAIDNVKEADIKRVADKMFSKPPTVVAYGDISCVPHYEEIRAALQAAGVGN